MKQSPGKADVTTQYIVELHHCFLNTGIISVFSTSRVIQTFSVLLESFKLFRYFPRVIQTFSVLLESFKLKSLTTF